MIISGLQKTTTIDYPGKIAAIVFTRGCNFRCGYCHNPELVNPDKFYPEIDEQEILDFLIKRKNVLEGVVITGGEPLIHKDIDQFIKKVKDLGYAIKLDTNGTSPKFLKELIDSGMIDYIAMDIKHDVDSYKKVVNTDLDSENIRKSIKIIMDSGVDYEFRTTVLPRLFNEDDFKKVGELIKGASKYYIQQFRPIKTLDESYAEEESFTAKELEQFRALMEQYVDTCTIRGII